MRIAVIAGGDSPERDVSLASGKSVAEALQKKEHKVTLFDPFQFSQAPSCFLSLDLLCALKEYDRVFLTLHGGKGEDGTVTAALQALGIPCTGSSPQGCMRAMDKTLSALLFRQAGLCVPARYTAAPAFPCVVKPRFGGSSIGVKLLTTQEDFDRHFPACETVPSTLVIEEYIPGREFSVGVLQGKALPPVEILPPPCRDFYDYESKYHAPATKELCPAPLSPSQTETISRLALTAHAALGLGAYSRIDFPLSSKDGQFYCLEANALPGMTERSLFPLCAQAAGIDFPALCDLLVREGCA